MAYISKSIWDNHIVTIAWVTLKGQSRSDRFSMAYISKSIQDNHRVTIGDG